jgi:hypothetical protein
MIPNKDIGLEYLFNASASKSRPAPRKEIGQAA